MLIGAVGSLIRRKGHDVLVRAVGQLGGAQPPHLLIASDGPEREPLEHLAAELGLQHRIHFLGYHEPITDLYASCDLMALASRADAFGLVLAEAGYSNRPVVATRVGGIPEVVVDSETGLLVPPDDVPALANALRHLANDEGLRLRLGAAARVRAETRFSVQRMATEFTETYGHLTGLPRTGLGWPTIATRSLPYTRMLWRRAA